MSTIIKCKICNEDIASNAKSCPKCGAKNKEPFYRKWWVWAIVVILIISSVSNGGNDEKTKPEESRTTAVKNEVAYNIGEIVTTDKFEINITNVETAHSVGSQYFKEEPSEGGVFIVVNWEYKNISNSPISSFSTPTIKLVDANKTKYDEDLNATTYYSTEANIDSKVLSDLNPDIKVKDASVFEISEAMYNSGGFSVFIDADKDFSVKIN